MYVALLQDSAPAQPDLVPPAGDRLNRPRPSRESAAPPPTVERREHGSSGHAPFVDACLRETLDRAGAAFPADALA